MDRNKARTISADVDRALAPILAAHGLTLDRTSGQYSATGITLRIRLSEAGAVSPEAAALAETARMFNLDTTTTATLPRIGACKLVGYAPRSRKFPFIVATTEGKRYKIPHTTAHAMFGKRSQVAA